MRGSSFQESGSSKAVTVTMILETTGYLLFPPHLPNRDRCQWREGATIPSQRHELLHGHCEHRAACVIEAILGGNVRSGPDIQAGATVTSLPPNSFCTFAEQSKTFHLRHS